MVAILRQMLRVDARQRRRRGEERREDLAYFVTAKASCYSEKRYGRMYRRRRKEKMEEKRIGREKNSKLEFKKRKIWICVCVVGENTIIY